MNANAFLTWLHRRSEEPEPTATVCYWKKAKLGQVKVIDIQHLNETLQLPLVDSFRERLVAEMTKYQSNFQLSRHCMAYESNVGDLSLQHMISIYANSGEYLDADEFLTFAEETMSSSLCEKVAKMT